MSNAYVFAVFNALSFQMVVSSPMVLYAKTLGAGATILGIIAGMMPLLVVFQIPAAQYIGRVGYRQFVYVGWGVRTLFVAGVIVVPLLDGTVNVTTQMALLLFLLFGYNLSRGISSCAWLPWLATLISADRRSTYLRREAACVNVASCVAFVLAGVCLGDRPEPWQFSILFAFSAIMALISLSYLRRIPDVETAPAPGRSSEPVPWLTLAKYPPFRRLLELNAAWSFAYGGITPFTVAFLKVQGGFSEQQTLFLTAVTFLGGWCSLWLLGPGMERWGSKPLITLTLTAWLVLLGGWIVMSGRAIGVSVGMILALQFAMGLMAALFNMANTRLAMTVAPVMGRDHFFALFSVVGNLTLGASPILWGLGIDVCERYRTETHGFEWNRFSLYYTGAAIAFLIAWALSRRIEEPKAVSVDAIWRELLERSPLKIWFRFWPR